MLYNRSSVGLKQGFHLGLIQPYCFTFDSNINPDVAFWILINDYFPAGLVLSLSVLISRSLQATDMRTTLPARASVQIGCKRFG